MLAAGSQVGRYVIKRKLAEGGMAEIFLASAVGPEGFAKDVVIKVVRSFLASDSQFVQMFIAEARLASRLNHANVVQIFDFGKHESSYYLAMEYVHGASLWDLRRRCRELSVPFPPILAAEVVAQVARGLQYAHSLSDNGQKIGVVHRDVTPHNVLLSFDGAVKLTDFGIAKATTSQTAPGMLKGKFAYMSPEQARGDKVDQRTDLFALGIVLWELVTGGKLFDGDSDLAVLRAVQESLIAPPSRVNPDVPQELSDVIMKALARPLEERFQSGFELERALANFVLRSAKSAEDTSVAAFLQQMFKEEIARGEAGQNENDERTDSGPKETLPPDDEFGVGDTFARKPQTITATPVGPNPAGPKTLTTPARRHNRGVMDDDDEPSKRTEEFEEQPKKPRTEQMPAFNPNDARRPSRKFDPLPIQEPSVLVRPSMQALPEMPQPRVGDETLRDARAASVVQSAPSQTPLAEEPQADLPPPASKSNTGLMVVLGILVLGLATGGGVIFFGPKTQPLEPAPDTLPKQDPPPSEPVVVAPPVVKKDPVEEPTVAATPDASTEVLVAAKDPEPVPAKTPDPVAVPKTTEPIKTVAAKKTGSLAVKAVPFATVIIQGKSYEVTGMKTLTVPAGTYEIQLKHPRKTAKEKITVPANGSTSVNFSAD
ncbi:MAG: protein kinase [Archangium sp.]|nr:protein kinase [Archangium sp.]